MTVKNICESLKAIASSIETNLLDPTTGGLKPQPDLVDDSKVLSDVETALVANGVVLSSQEQTIISGAIALLMTLGGFIK